MNLIEKQIFKITDAGRYKKEALIEELLKNCDIQKISDAINNLIGNNYMFMDLNGLDRVTQEQLLFSLEKY